jgi:hypothetical protein
MYTYEYASVTGMPEYRDTSEWVPVILIRYRACSLSEEWNETGNSAKGEAVDG